MAPEESFADGPTRNGTEYRSNQWREQLRQGLTPMRPAGEIGIVSNWTLKPVGDRWRPHTRTLKAGFLGFYAERETSFDYLTTNWLSEAEAMERAPFTEVAGNADRRIGWLIVALVLAGFWGV